MSDTMRAAAVGGFGGVEQIKIKDMPVPVPAGGEVLVRVHGAGINPIDNKFRNREVPAPIWQNPDFPVIAGWDLSGTVAEAAGGFAAGDDVYGMVRFPHFAGTCAEFATAPSAHLSLKPQNIDHLHAAGVPLAALTAWQAIEAGGLKSGQTALIHAAAGGVGLIACQWAKHLGATVIGCVGTQEKAELAKAHGCDHPILYRDENVPERVNEITGGEGVPVVYDSVGKDSFEDSLDCLRPFGLMVSFGSASGPVEPFNIAALGPKGSLHLTRQTLGTHTATRALLDECAGALFDVVGGGQVKINVNQTYPLAETAQAHRDLEARKTTGSTVLTV